MKRFVLTLLLLLPVTGCNTVNVANPFTALKPDYAELPVDSLRAAALDIERAVKEGNREFTPATAEGLKLDSPELLQAIRTRAARKELVQGFLNTGHAFEQSNGLLGILRTRDYKESGTSRDRDRNALMVMGENNDRWTLYEGILKVNHYPDRALSAVQDIFYQARVEVLDAGQKYGAEGEVVVKQ